MKIKDLLKILKEQKTDRGREVVIVPEEGKNYEPGACFLIRGLGEGTVQIRNKKEEKEEKKDVFIIYI